MKVRLISAFDPKYGFCFILDGVYNIKMCGWGLYDIEDDEGRHFCLNERTAREHFELL